MDFKTLIQTIKNTKHKRVTSGLGFIPSNRYITKQKGYLSLPIRTFKCSVPIIVEINTGTQVETYYFIPSTYLNPISHTYEFSNYISNLPRYIVTSFTKYGFRNSNQIGLLFTRTKRHKGAINSKDNWLGIVIRG
jgi:hypothetical protein